MKKLIILFILLFSISELFAQILFFNGSIEQAINESKKDNKYLFIDVYADWCGPCKVLEKDVFSKTDIGNYFNLHFICLKLNAEDEQNKKWLKKYNINALPTLLFLDSKEKEINRIEGTTSPEMLLREGKITIGDRKNFEEYFNDYKKDPSNTETMKQLLMDAPLFMSTLDSYNQKKWISRIEPLFELYVKNKRLNNMINVDDFKIITNYKDQIVKNDSIFDFMLKNHERYSTIVSYNEIAGYLTNLYNRRIIELCQQGNEKYIDWINRLDNDQNLNKIYNYMKIDSISVRDMIMLLAQSTYFLYKKNDKQFFETQNRYLQLLGSNATIDDYTQPLEALYTLYNGKLSTEMQHYVIQWIDSALKLKMTDQLRCRLLIMMGDCFIDQGNNEKAKQCFNQSYLICLKIENQSIKKQLQEYIQQRTRMLQ